MNQSINTDSKNSKEPQQKYRLGTVSIKILWTRRNKEAIKERKQSLSKFCKYPTKENLNNVRLFKAKARRTIKSAERKS